MYFLVYAFFICDMQKIFSLRDTMDNQCANIFSTHAIVYGSHSVQFAFIERENIFHVYPQFFLKFGLWVFIFPTSQSFPKTVFPKTCFVFPIFIGGEKFFFFLTFVVLRRSCCSSQGELSPFSIEFDSFVSLILYFLWPFVAYVFCQLFV